MSQSVIGMSVGNGGQNVSNDVLAVQRMLNRCLNLLIPLSALKEDGKCGQRTIEAIAMFQQRWMHMRQADGRVDPLGKTERALTQAAGTMPGSTPPPVSGPASVPPRSVPPPPPAPSNGTSIAWGAKVSPAFKQKVITICNRLGINPDDLMACMAFESGGTFNPAIRNAAGSGAVGLIQFMPSTARNLGTTTQELAAMSAEEQLDYVELYFAGRKHLKTLEDLYMAILWPAAIGKDLEFVLFQKPSKAYDQNAGLDHDRDGRVTKFEAAASVRNMLTKGRGYAG
jgi:hypothetical protein